MAGLPWCDCKVAFGIDDDDPLWAWWDTGGQKLLPVGWSLTETDGAGARMVAIFRIEGELRQADGDKVAVILRDIADNAL